MGTLYARSVGSIIGQAGVLLLLGCVAACSSSPSAPSGGLTAGAATIDGTFTFMPAHSWASAAASGADSNPFSIFGTNLTGGADSCRAAGAASNAASIFQVTVGFGPNKVPKPGTYTLGEGWQASYRLADTSCATADSGSAIKGTLEIDTVAPSIHGIADMTFPTGRVIATFDAPFCTAPAGTNACTTRPPCPAGHGADQSPPAEACLASP